MKLRIRGNSLRLRVSKTELAKIAETGKVEDTVRFSSEQSLRYGIEVRPTGAVTATFAAAAILVTLPKARLDLWLRPGEVSVEGSQPIGGGKVLQIVLEKDEPRHGRGTAARTIPLRRYNVRRHEGSLRVSSRVERCYNIAELRKLAKRNMPAPMFHYIDGAADDEWTLRRNTAAFDSVEFLPRALVDVSTIDMSTTLFGQRIDWPYFCAPTALQRLFHHEGEGGTARAAHASGTIFSLSSVSSTNIEDAAKLSPGPKVFQVYMFRDRGLSREFVQRAKDSGYVALQLTVDVTVSGNRERDIVTGMTVPPKLALMSLIDIAMKPKWVYKHLTTPKIEVANIAHRPPPGSEKLGGIIQFLNAQIDRSITWKDAEWMIKEWGGPFAIKGIMTGEDAKRAADIGATRGHGQQPRRPAARFLAGAVRRAQGDRRRRRRPPRGDSRRRRAPRHAHLEGARARRARVLGRPAASLRPRRRRRSRRASRR